MRRRWKYRIADLFLRIYTRKQGRLSARDSFDPAEDFYRITLFSSTALGDFLLNTPAIKAIRRRYPAAEITLVASYKNRALVDRDETGLLYDRVVYWNNKLLSIGKLVREITAGGLTDLTVILHSHAPYDLIAAIMAGSKYVFRDNLMRMNHVQEYNQWLTNYLPLFYGHYIQRKLELVSSLGARIDDVRMCLPFSVTPALTTENNLLIGMQMATARAEKNWPVAYYTTLAQSLLERYQQVQIVLIGTSSDCVLVKEFMRQLPQEFTSRIISYVGQTSLRELAAIIASMNVLVTGDTGPLHVAVALGIRTVSLFIQTDHRETAPYQDHHLHTVLTTSQQCLQIEHEPYGAQCIIKPEIVFRHIESMLDSTTPGSCKFLQ